MINEFLKNKDYEVVQIDNNNKEGHGHILSVKVVMPTFCQAHCEFCFNKLTMATQQHDWHTFRSNFYKSLDMLLRNLKNRKISIDITGNEPTFHIEHFNSLMKDLAYFKSIYPSKISKIVLTTNGYHLYECVNSMINVVDIVNISLHYPSYKTRQELFKTKAIPSNNDLKIINEMLNSHGISSTAVAVFANECSFKYIVNNFVKFSKEMGFKDTRIRIDFTTKNERVRNMFDIKFKDDEVVYHQRGLDSKYFDIDGYNVSIYRGVPELIDYVIGVELVIDDDGNIYLDYNKNIPMTSKDIKLFNDNIYVIK